MALYSLASTHFKGTLWEILPLFVFLLILFFALVRFSSFFLLSARQTLLFNVHEMVWNKGTRNCIGEQAITFACNAKKYSL